MFGNASYSCETCNEVIEDVRRNEIVESRCNVCGDRLLITLGNNVFVQKRPNELLKGENILFLSKDKFHEILSINYSFNDAVSSINLQGFGKYSVNNDLINVIWDNNHEI